MATLLIYVLSVIFGAGAFVAGLSWLGQLELVFGTSSAATLEVAAVLLCGVAAGAALTARRAGALRQPGKSFGLLALMLAIFAIFFPLVWGLAAIVYGRLGERVFDAAGVHEGTRFLILLGVIAAPALVFGAAPVMLAQQASLRRAATAAGSGDESGSAGVSAALLGLMLLGGTGGLWLAGAHLLPRVGLQRTGWAAAGMFVLVGIAAFMLLEARAEATARRGRRKDRKRTAERAGAEDVNDVLPCGPDPQRARWDSVCTAVAAAGAVICAICWNRVLRTAFGPTAYTTLILLTVIVLSLGGGVLAAVPVGTLTRRTRAAGGWLLLAAGVAAAAMLPGLARLPGYTYQLVQRSGADFAALLRGQWLLAAGLMSLPVVLAGAAIGLWPRVRLRYGVEAGAAMGQAVASVALGAVAGIVAAALLALVNTRAAVRIELAVGGLGLAMGGWMLVSGSAARRGAAAAISALAVVAVPTIAFLTVWDRAVFVQSPVLSRADPAALRGSQTLIAYDEGLGEAVAVTSGPPEHELVTLCVNGQQQDSTALLDLMTRLMAGHLPGMFGAADRNVCVLGAGSGLTVAAVARRSGIERIDVVEPSGLVARAAGRFAEYTSDALRSDKRVRVVRADAREYLRLSARAYDVIIGTRPEVWTQDGAQSFTREFFRLCRERLAPGGRLCVWLPTYAVAPETIRSIVRTLAEELPYVSIWEAGDGDYVLLAAAAPFGVPIDEFAAQHAAPAVRADLFRVGLGVLPRLLGSFIGAGEAVRVWAATAQVITDDRNPLTFSAPRALSRVNDLEIPLELAKQVQQSPIGEVVSASLTVAMHQAWDEAAMNVMNARAHRLRGLQLMRRGEVQEAYKEWWQGFLKVDEGNLLIYLRMKQARREILAFAPSIAEEKEIKPMLEALGTMREPPIAPRKGASPVAVAQMLARLAEEVLRIQPLPDGAILLATNYMNDARSLAPEDAVVQQSAAMFLLMLGKRDEAIAVIDPYLEAHPDDGRAHYIRARLYVQQRKWDPAFEHLEAALRLGALTPEDARLDDGLEGLKFYGARFYELLEKFGWEGRTESGGPPG